MIAQYSSIGKESVSGFSIFAKVLEIIKEAIQSDRENPRRSQRIEANKRIVGSTRNRKSGKECRRTSNRLLSGFMIPNRIAFLKKPSTLL